jgi:ribose transport system substrate-binding protein
MSEVLSIAVIPQGSTHRYWKLMHGGAEKAAHDLQAEGAPIELIWKAPIREGDHEEHKQIVESFVRKGVHGLVLSPFDNHFLVRTVEEAERKNVPTVVVDSELDSLHIVSYVGTDNRKAGARAADRMGELLHGTGVIFMQRYQKGSASTEAREAGFIDRVRTAFPNMSVQASTEYAGGTRDTAQRAASAFLSKRADNIHGVFTPNESSTTGMLMALQGIPQANRLTFVGFDHNDTLAAAIECKQIHGLIAQDAFKMGELGVRAIVDHLRGRPVAKRVDTGAILVTPENLKTPAIQQFLNPPLPH